MPPSSNWLRDEHVNSTFDMHRDVSCPWWIVLSSDAGRHTPRGATLSLPEDSSTPGNEQENQGHSTNGSGPNYAFTTTAAWESALT